MSLRRRSISHGQALGMIRSFGLGSPGVWPLVLPALVALQMLSDRLIVRERDSLLDLLFVWTITHSTFAVFRVLLAVIIQVGSI